MKKGIKSSLTKRVNVKPDLYPRFDQALTDLKTYRLDTGSSMNVAQNLLGYCGLVLTEHYTGPVYIWTVKALDQCWQIFVQAYEMASEWRFENTDIEEELLPSRYWVRELVLQTCGKLTPDLMVKVMELGWGTANKYKDPQKMGYDVIQFDVYGEDYYVPNNTADDGKQETNNRAV